ncbi:puf family RNA-binding protein [Marasmius fiardii PR-910]|nr:puf family RNA-binding protein [Marasmius fiardii PR-910]
MAKRATEIETERRNSKKERLEKPEKPIKKRSQPITQNQQQPESSESEEEEEQVLSASRESHRAQKLLQDQRKASKPHSQLLSTSKAIWALARQKSIPSAERAKHIKQLTSTIKGHVKDIVFKHDASRIIQTIVKYGKSQERSMVAEELKGKYRELAMNKYSKFLVTKLIRFCPSHRPGILLEFQGHVLKLLLHREASSVLADAFELYANAYERSILLREFYGKETALFTSSNMPDAEKEKAKKGLKGVLEGADDARVKRTLAALKENLESIFNNPDKGAVTHAIVHRALWEYLASINDLPEKNEREKLRREIFETCQDIIPEMVHTKDGSRAVREFLAQGSAKDRKQILKSLKPHIERMCLDDEAQTVLFTAIDVIDDTKLLHRSLITPITTSALSLYTSPQGRRSLLYLLVPRTTRHFTPALISSLAQTDSVRDETSKKAEETRREEVRTAASPELLAWVTKKGDEVVRDPGGSLVVGEVVLYADGDKTSATKTILNALSTPYPSTDPSTGPHPIDIPHTSRLYKTLLQGGHFNHTTKTVETTLLTWDATRFAVDFVQIVPKDVVLGMCLEGEMGGRFVIAELCGALATSTPATEVGVARKKLKEWFTSDVRRRISETMEEGKGGKVLNEKVDAL